MAGTLGGANNSIFIDACKNLQNVQVSLTVTDDLITNQDAGFSLQLNAYPPPGQKSQGETLTWLQYIIYVQDNSAWYEIQYWANNSGANWPPGYTPAPNTSPWLPVFPNDYYLTKFGSVPSNRVLKGSTLTIALTTDTKANVVNALFSISRPAQQTIGTNFAFPNGTQYPICAFEVNLVGPGNFANTIFTFGAGSLTYSVSPGNLAVQNGGPGSSCGEWGGFTGETSNILYGPVTPQSGAIVKQNFWHSWQGIPAASGSALHGYWGSDNSQHVNFIDNNGHIHEMYIHPGAIWVDNDLTSASHGISAASGSAIDSYWGNDNSQHVNFIDKDGHVHELYIHPGSGWTDNDLTKLSRGATAISGSALAGYWGSDNSQHVIFIDVEGHIHELYIHPGAPWVDSDLTKATHGTPAVSGSALTAYWGSDSSQHVIFTDIHGHVHELYIHPGKPWVDNDLTIFSRGVPAAPPRPAITNGSQTAANRSALSAYWGSDNSQHINFIDVDGNVHELYIHSGSGWVDNNLTKITNGKKAAPGIALNSYWGKDNSQHVNFTDLDGHVHELYIHPGAGWVDIDLTSVANGVPAAFGSALTGYWGTSDNSQHVNFITVDGHVHELYIHPGAGWVDNDLSAQTV